MGCALTVAAALAAVALVSRAAFAIASKVLEGREFEGLRREIERMEKGETDGRGDEDVHGPLP